MKDKWEKELASIIGWEDVVGAWFDDEGREVEDRMKKLKAFIRSLLTSQKERMVEDWLRIAKSLKGYHCDKPGCDHNLEQFIAVLEHSKAQSIINDTE